MNTHDSILRAHAPFKRYASLRDAGIDISTLTINDADEVKRLTKSYREKFTRLLSSKFTKTVWKRSENGPIVNVDEAIAGESECFRRRLPHKSPLRVGINVSATSGSREVYAIRGAAVLALIDLCKSRGQSVIVELAYGNGYHVQKTSQCHVRISLVNPNVETLMRVTCSYSTLTEIANKCISPLAQDGAFFGYYRFSEFPWKAEYDFVLDRIETNDAATEEKRVLDRLAQLKLT